MRSYHCQSISLSTLAYHEILAQPVTIIVCPNLPCDPITAKNLHCPCVVWEIEGGEENEVEGVTELSVHKKLNLVIYTFSFPLPGHSTIDGEVEGV
jgi:hypothetical protein